MVLQRVDCGVAELQVEGIARWQIALAWNALMSELGLSSRQLVVNGNLNGRRNSNTAGPYFQSVINEE